MRITLSKIPGQVYLWLAVPILASSSSVIRKLTEIGSQNFMDGHNPISFCNVLFAGNLCALAVMLLFYRQQLIPSEFKKITRSEWQVLILSAVLSGALIPAMIFQALAAAPVNNIVLLARIELPIVLVASIVFLKEQFSKAQIVGAIVVLVGISIAVLGNGSMSSTSSLSLGKGEILTIMSSVLIAASSLLNKKYLSEIPLGIAHVFRLGVGTLFFFIVANVLYGPSHFGEIFSPFLWKWMLVYGGVIIVIGQSFWAKGFRETPVSVSAIVSCFSPIAGMVFAYWILAESPSLGQLFGSAILLLGLLLSTSDAWRLKPQRHKQNLPPQV
jgi:drug/metabolite transporter (DMT)-like permease